jgi:acyl-coenzyme A thioesterase 13
MRDSMSTEPTDENKRLLFLQKYIGVNMTESISPVGRWLNGKLVDINEGSMQAEFVVRKDMTNPMGVLHGGIAATILDDVVGTMVYALGRDFAYTSVNLNCDFLHAAKLNDIITAYAKVIRAGKNIIHVEGTITNTGGKIIAKCTSNLIQTSLKIPS